MEWGQNRNNKETTILLSKHDPLVNPNDVLVFYKKYIYNANIVLEEGMHSSWLDEQRLKKYV
jgi:hypothetical protein